MSVSDGSRNYYNTGGNLKVYSNDGSGPDNGVSFDEDKFAYWTSKCSSSLGNHRWQENFLKASLNKHDPLTDVHGTRKPYMRLNYEFK